MGATVCLNGMGSRIIPDSGCTLSVVRLSSSIDCQVDTLRHQVVAAQLCDVC